MAKQKPDDEIVQVRALKRFPYKDRGVFNNNIVEMPRSDAKRYIENGYAEPVSPDTYNRRDMRARDGG